MSNSNVLGLDRGCMPFRFSNDKWSATGVHKLRNVLDGQQTPPEASAALVVGSGGLPYLLSHLATRRIFCVDLSDDVLALTAWRVGQLDHFSNWDDYHFGVEGHLSVQRTPQRHTYVDEFLTATESGLQGDYIRAWDAGGSTEFTFIRGNLSVMAPHIGRIATEEGRDFTLVNFTNVANYTGSDRRVLNAVLDTLPIAEDAAIVDSAPQLNPTIYSPDEYRALVF